MYYVTYNTLYGGNPLGIIFDKVDEYIRKYDELNIQHYLILFKNMREFLIELGAYFVKKQ